MIAPTNATCPRCNAPVIRATVKDASGKLAGLIFLSNKATQVGDWEIRPDMFGYMAKNTGPHGACVESPRYTKHECRQQGLF